MEERARELADAMVPFVPKKKKKSKKSRRRALPPPKASTLYVARALAARALQKARLAAIKAPLLARNLALAGKDAVKNFYIQKLERTIADEADQRLMDDKPEPIYPAVRMVKQAAFPFALEEQLVLRGRGLTMKFCLTALRALGKPYEMPEEYMPSPREKTHRFHRRHLSKSQVAHMRRKELAKLRLRQALEKANPKVEAVVEVRPPTPSSSESEDEPLELPDIFGDSGAKPENLIKREKFHLPILAIPKGINS